MSFSVHILQHKFTDTRLKHSSSNKYVPQQTCHNRRTQHACSPTNTYPNKRATTDVPTTPFCSNTSNIFLQHKQPPLLFQQSSASIFPSRVLSLSLPLPPLCSTSYSNVVPSLNPMFRVKPRYLYSLKFHLIAPKETQTHPLGRRESKFLQQR